MRRLSSKRWIRVLGSVSHFFKKLLPLSSQNETEFRKTIKILTGFTPKNPELYRLAIKHSSAAQQVKDHNERLEYLGDAVLGVIVAEFLFKKFPFKEEGFLTEIRSRIVNGEHLAALAKKIGLSALIEHDKRQKGSALSRSSMHGDALEALIAAVFLDYGFNRCKTFVLNKLIQPHVDIDSLVDQNANFKSQLIEWAQRKGKKVNFEIINESGSSHNREFMAEVLVDGISMGQGKGLSKKKAEQAAAEKALSFVMTEA